MSALRSMAKQALRDQPQLLEKIGINLRTSLTSKHRNAGKNAAATRKAKNEKPELVTV